MRTFSGTHEFDPTVLVDTDADDAGNADEIVWDIEHGLCPRCKGPLPEFPEYPAGSRITQCRSIPICGRCGTDEAYELLLDGGYSPASYWPISLEDIDRRKAEVERHSRPVVFNVADLNNPRNTGGWAQYGEPRA